MNAVAAGPAATSGRRWVASVESALATLIAIPAGLLVVAEVVVMLAGVIARYVLHEPLVWSDELASTLFLWLAMLGSVIALQRNEHMRMTALVSKASPQVQAFLEVVAVAVPILFLSMMVLPGIEFASDENFVTTPALDISGAWHAAAFPVGALLMLSVALLRLARVANGRMLAVGIGVVAVIAAGLWGAEPVLRTLGNANLVIFFVGYITLVTDVPDLVLVGRMNEGMSHLILLAVPLFVVLGLLMEMTGIARTMVAFLVSLLGHVRGGLYYVLVGAMYLVSGISGSKAADMAAVAPVLFPEMRKRGEKQGELLAVLAATGAQTETIPPSLVLITIGSVTGVSIAALFTGGLLPGLVLGLVLCLVARWRIGSQPTRPAGEWASWSTIGRTFLIALPGIALPFRA
jgi:TRAP-type C4-dicarboxylate transport system permease small subunit